jgi:sec-independent protein translocase protein TatA
LFGLGAGEIILILIVILVLFGGKKIPDVMQGLGKGIREFKKASRDIEDDLKSSIVDDPDEKKGKKT